jgi:hypothetical protein
MCALYLFLGSDPVWSTRGLKQCLLLICSKQGLQLFMSSLRALVLTVLSLDE